MSLGMPFNKLPTKDKIEKTIKALKARNIDVIFLEKGAEAFEKLKEIIRPGSSIMTGGSVTLEQIGFIPFLEQGSHPWLNLKKSILSEKNILKQQRLRKESSLADFYLASVHAITEDGQIMIASATGSQIPAYAYNSDEIIWIVGAQKIVPDLQEAFSRVKNYCLPLEDKRMKENGFSGSQISMMLILEKLALPNRKITIILVNEVLGF